MELANTNAEEGTTFLNLKNAAIAKGFANVSVYKLNLENLNNVKLPALVYLNVEGSEIGHYAVLCSIKGDNYNIQDPAEGKVAKTKEEFAKMFGGYAMINGEIAQNSIQNNATITNITTQTTEAIGQAITT